MKRRIDIILFILFISLTSISQELIIKKDSIKILAKIYEINSTEIRYSEYADKTHSEQKILKQLVSRILFRNGTEIVFKSDATITHDTTLVLNIKSKRKVIDTLKLGDYIKFNIHAGIVINNDYSNLERRQPQPSHVASEEYSAYNKNKYNCNLNVGFNFLLGKNDYIKHVIGISYLRSKGEFDYNSSFGGYTSYNTNLHYVSKIDFINFTTGLRFAISKRKHFFIEALAAFNLIARANVRYSGTKTTTYSEGYPPLYIHAVETEYYNNTKTGPEDKQMVHTISLCPKASYEFKLKQQILGVYFSYNISYRFRLPWYMVGVTYYPFKKLR